MTSAKRIILTTALLLTAIGNVGCLSLLQPVNRIEREFNFIDMDAPALRLARPVKAYLLRKSVAEDGSVEWVPAGKGIVPAGAYVKGRAPENKTE